MPLNAYALDFYKHGSLTALTTDNWYLLPALVQLNSSVVFHIVPDGT